MNVEPVIPPLSPAVEDFFGAAATSEDPLAMLIDWMADRRLQPSDLPDVVRTVWSAERPPSTKGVRKWVALFRAAAYPVPAVPLTIYRGTTRGRRRGMAWTTDLDKAREFADKCVTERGYREAEVVAVVVPPAAVLCHVNEHGEAEIVIDPSMLPAVRRIEIHPAGAPDVVLPAERSFVKGRSSREV